MIQSMTAFAKQEFNVEGSNLIITIRTVNHRYFDLILKMPEVFQSLEGEIRNSLKKELKRGRVECVITLVKEKKESLALNPLVLAELQSNYNTLAQFFPNLQMEFTRFLNWPGLMVTESFNMDSALILQTLETVISQLKQMRIFEGEQLTNFLNIRLTKIENLVAKIEGIAEKTVQCYRERLKEKVAKIITGVELNPYLLGQEVIYFAERSDIAEELTRLKAHVLATRKILTCEEDEVGKKLDFIMQEFNREANTLSAKAVDLEISDVALELKVLIEQMREQTQNIL